MISYEWNEEKNKILKEKRGVTFEDVVIAIDEGRLLSVETNSSKGRGHQFIYIVEIEGYAYIVPFVIKNETIHFLKTIYPSRKATKKYLAK